MTRIVHPWSRCNALRRVRSSLALALLSQMLVSAAPSTSAMAAPEATLTLNPASGRVGVVVAVAGSGYNGIGSDTPVALSVGGTLVSDGCSMSNAGRFKCSFSIPSKPAGAYAVTASARDKKGNRTSAATTLQITADPASPRLTVPGSQSVQYSDALRFDVSATDTDNPASALRITASGLPSGLALVDHLDGTATIAGSIAASAGEYDALIKATDPGGLTDLKAVKITVLPENAALTYTGSTRVYSGAPITLASTITQAADRYPGDIKKATVEFGLTDGRGLTTWHGPVAASSGGIATASIGGGLPAGVYSITVQIATGNGFYQAAPYSIVALIVADAAAPLRAVQYAAGGPPAGNKYTLPYFQFWQKVRILNSGSAIARNVKAYVDRVAGNTRIVNGGVTVGDIPAGKSQWSAGAFALEVNLALPANRCDSFTWRIEYDDQANNHRVLQSVPQFPPGPAPGGCR